LQTNPIAAVMYGREWVFPTLEIFHIVGFSVAIGTIALVDLSLIGLGLERQTVSRLLRATAPLTLISLAIVLTAGAILFLTDPRSLPLQFIVSVQDDCPRCCNCLSLHHSPQCRFIPFPVTIQEHLSRSGVPRPLAQCGRQRPVYCFCISNSRP